MEVDEILFALLSPARRELLRILTRAPGYPLALSREIGLSPQAVAKHLAILEDAGLVRQLGPRRGSLGAPRVYYSLTRGITLTVDLGPGLFRVAIRDWPRHLPRDLPGLVEALRDVEERLRELEEERLRLLRLKSEILRRLGFVEEL